MMGGASLFVSGGAMGLYFFSSLEHYNQGSTSDNRFSVAFLTRFDVSALAIFGLWFTLWEVGIAVGDLTTNVYQTHLFTVVGLSLMVWLNPVIMYFLSKIRNILSQMTSSEKSYYLSINIIFVGISSLTPMIYLSMDTFKCLNSMAKDHSAWEQCSAIFLPQMSICWFLLMLMVIKIAIVPLSMTVLTRDKLITLDIPRRVISQGVLFGLSFLLNMYQFASMVSVQAITRLLPY